MRVSLENSTVKEFIDYCRSSTPLQFELLTLAIQSGIFYRNQYSGNLTLKVVEIGTKVVEIGTNNLLVNGSVTSTPNQPYTKRRTALPIHLPLKKG